MKKRSIVTESPRAAQSRAPAERERVRRPLAGATFVIAAAQPSQLPPAGPPEIAFAGRSNSGKSSAINALARQTGLAFASRTPGRTQQIVYFQLQGGALVADLPGYGYSVVPRDVKRGWQTFLWDYVTTRTTLVGLVVVVDARHGLKPLDETLLEGFLPSGRPALILATKSDKLNRAERRDAVAAIRHRIDERFPHHAPQVTIIGFSTLSRDGVEAADLVLDEWVPRE